MKWAVHCRGRWLCPHGKNAWRFWGVELAGRHLFDSREDAAAAAAEEREASGRRGDRVTYVKVGR